MSRSKDGVKSRGFRSGWLAIGLVGAAVFVAACGSDGNGTGANVDFGTFLTGLIQNTTENAGPVQTNDFNFLIREDANQFDALLQ